ncbi:hypothetical protein L1281_001961 [Neisseria sp. HSC-16F19]|nr:cation:proton antiporter [Neisseria sp. HSC-16F19]MCP2041363.1 hypothetical protein [Neisseria sp. HSC-16F19]
MDIELHFQKLQFILDQIDIQKKCQFSAWCCNALAIEQKIKENLTQITNSNENYQLCDAIIKAGWYDSSQINIEISQKTIEDINWDDDDPLNDMVETQGTMELLASIRNMLLGIQQKSSDGYYFAACAENVINWKDALANFPYSKDGKIEEENLKREYEIQLLFLDDLRNNLITLQDIKKYR